MSDKVERGQFEGNMVIWSDEMKTCITAGMQVHFSEMCSISKRGFPFCVLWSSRSRCRRKLNVLKVTCRLQCQRVFFIKGSCLELLPFLNSFWGAFGLFCYRKIYFKGGVHVYDAYVDVKGAIWIQHFKLQTNIPVWYVN